MLDFSNLERYRENNRIEAKKAIRKYSRDFEGALSDQDVMKLVGVSRNTYYKYKREMAAAN